MSSITLTGLTKRYGAAPVIDELSLEISPGEFMTLLGPSGCGKTTTLRSVAGLETPDAGTIHIGERVVTDSASGRMLPPHSRNLGMVFQSYAIWPHLTVFDNVAYPLRRKRFEGRKPARDEVRRRVMTTLASVGLEHTAHRSATQLSGGQQQRVALARAIVADPEVLLFDEPLSNLDAQLRITLRDEIRRVHTAGEITSVYVTHDQAEAFALSDRIAVMLDGRIAQLDSPAALVAAPASHAVAQFLGIENLYPATVRYVGDANSVVDVPALQSSLTSASSTGVLTVGQAVHVGVRASALSIRHDVTAEGPNLLRGRLAGSTFLGESAQYSVTVGSTSVTVRERPGAAGLDGPLLLDVAPESVRVFCQ